MIMSLGSQAGASGWVSENQGMSSVKIIEMFSIHMEFYTSDLSAIHMHHATKTAGVISILQKGKLRPERLNGWFEYLWTEFTTEVIAYNS